MRFSVKSTHTKNLSINNKSRNGKVAIPVSHNQQQPKMIWGRATWLFLHTLADKVKQNEFSSIRQKLLDFIVQICSLLPCPICKNHAENYIRNVNFNTIKNKQDLKFMLYTFHNSVNKNKGVTAFPYDKLDSTYGTVNLQNATNYFFMNFRHNGFMRAVVDNNKRNDLKAQIRDWMIQNSNCFS